MNIQESLKTLYYYQVFSHQNNKLIFNSGRNAFICDFLKEYGFTLNSSSNKKNELDRILLLEESYKEKFEQLIYPNVNHENELEAFLSTQEEIKFKLVEINE